ncbi:MAG TPA: hypothetical protein VF444_05160 [Pseudonocardiaceae bacterium]
MSNEGIMICAAPGTRWPLTIDDFATNLRSRWPNVRTWLKHSLRTNDDYLDFDVPFPDYTRSGAYFNGTMFTLGDDTPEFWGSTVEWFLSLLPQDAQIVGIMEAASEMATIPRNSTATRIVAILDELNSR